jgi:hypothetical protein
LCDRPVGFSFIEFAGPFAVFQQKNKEQGVFFYMKKVILAFSFAVVASVSGMAQAVDDYKKGEVFVGYSNGQVDTGFDTGDSPVDFFRERENFHGLNVSGVYNLNRFVGIKGDVSGTYNDTRFTSDVVVGNTVSTVSVETNNSLYNFLGGVQLKDNSKSGRFKPFAHALVGAAHARAKLGDIECEDDVCTLPAFPEDSFSETGFAGAFGGGIDIRLGDRFQIRAIQVDYNPMRLGGETSHNVRIGAGIVF